jgi:hypothetical protein
MHKPSPLGMVARRGGLDGLGKFGSIQHPDIYLSATRNPSSKDCGDFFQIDS